MDYEKELQTLEASSDENNNVNIDNPLLVLYGAGALGRMAMDIMAHTDKYPAHIVDKKARGKIGKIEIESLNDLSEEIKRNALFLVTICTVPYHVIAEELSNAGIEHIMPFYTYAYLAFPEWLSNGWFISEITPEIKEKILSVCRLLAHDDCSIHHYLQFCWWKLRGKEVIYEDYPVLSGKKYFHAPCMPVMGKKEFFIDCGCHEGGTIRMFMEKVAGCFDKVIAFEPDLTNLMYAKQTIHDSRVIFDERAVSLKAGKTTFISELGFASKIGQNGNRIVDVVSIDEMHLQPTIIKIHVEGNEYSVMCGAMNTIKQNRPIVMVFADHTKEGLLEIPSFVQKLEDYKLYFNLHDYCGNSAVFYMIPDERMKENES